MISNVKNLLAHTVYRKWTEAQKEVILRNLNCLWELFEWVNAVAKSNSLDIPAPPNSDGLSFTPEELLTLYYYLTLFGEVLGIRNWSAFNYYQAEMTEKFIDNNPAFKECEIEVTEDGSIYVHVNDVLPFTKRMSDFEEWQSNITFS